MNPVRVHDLCCLQRSNIKRIFLNINLWVPAFEQKLETSKGAHKQYIGILESIYFERLMKSARYYLYMFRMGGVCVVDCVVVIGDRENSGFAKREFSPSNPCHMEVKALSPWCSYSP